MLRYIILMVLMANVASAGTIKPGYAACLTEDLLNEFIKYSIQDDELGVAALVGNNQCFILAGGLKASVIDTTWTGKVKFRVYAGGGSLILWGPMEMIER